MATVTGWRSAVRLLARRERRLRGSVASLACSGGQIRRAGAVYGPVGRSDMVEAPGGSGPAAAERGFYVEPDSDRQARSEPAGDAPAARGETHHR